MIRYNKGFITRILGSRITVYLVSNSDITTKIGIQEDLISDERLHVCESCGEEGELTQIDFQGVLPSHSRVH